MDVLGALEDIVASPLTLAIGTVVGFVAGLVVRPFIEARSTLYKETVSSRRQLQRETLVELQTTLAILDPRPVASALKPDARRNEAERRLEVLLHQVNDLDVKAEVQRYLWELERHYQRTSPGARPVRVTPRKYLRDARRHLGYGLSYYYDNAQRAIGAALNRL